MAAASGVVDQMQTMHDEMEKLVTNIVSNGSLPSAYAWLISRYEIRYKLSNITFLLFDFYFFIILMIFFPSSSLLIIVWKKS